MRELQGTEVPRSGSAEAKSELVFNVINDLQALNGC